MRYLLLIFMACTSFTALAHKPSDSYLAMSVDGNEIRGHWDIALRDLEYALGLDANDDGQIIWRELRQRQAAVFAYAFNRLKITADQQHCALQPLTMMVDEHSDGRYAVLNFQAACRPGVKQLEIGYQLFFDLDPQHRGLLTIHNGTYTGTSIFSPAQPQQTFALNSVSHPGRELLNFAYEGVWHIWQGFDHILFLLSLLLPAALYHEHEEWRAKQNHILVFWDALQVVTAFTLAHSITLSLTALQYIALPSRWVESAIAASVICAALNNIYPVLSRHRTWLAFGFGLIHGMGIASVLLDMGLPASQRVLSLLGFNLGVEAGQLLIVAAALPLIVVFSRSRYYPALVLKLGSASIAMSALVWLVERSLDFQIKIG